MSQFVRIISIFSLLLLVSCDDNYLINYHPSLSITDANITEGDSGVSNLIFTISLSTVANGDVNVDYATSNGTAIAGVDYTSSSGTLTIASGITSNTLTIEVSSDIVQENNETLTVALSNLSANATLDDDSATGIIIDNDKQLNDTGITFGGSFPYDENNIIDCNNGIENQQDCGFGRDAILNNDGDGYAGFSYTKLGINGNDLPASATTWFCVRDNVTGLVWEIKQGGNNVIGDEGLHDADDRYSWYNTNPETNGGADGHADAGGAICGGYALDSSLTYCNTQAYVVRVNNMRLCGAMDWRMPNKKELFGLVNFNRIEPSIDMHYFPYTKSGVYFSSSPYAFDTLRYTDSYSAWFISFRDGSSSYVYRSKSGYVRLVRSGQ